MRPQGSCSELRLRSPVFASPRNAQFYPKHKVRIYELNLRRLWKLRHAIRLSGKLFLCVRHLKPDSNMNKALSIINEAFLAKWAVRALIRGGDYLRNSWGPVLWPQLFLSLWSCNLLRERVFKRFTFTNIKDMGRPKKQMQQMRQMRSKCGLISIQGC